MNAEFRFPPAIKDPAESLPVVLDLYDLCANKWRGNEAFGSAEYVRPSAPNGYAYECTTAGVSGSREPRWPTTAAQTVVDGSVTWTCRVPGASGLNPITSPTGTSDPAGLTIASVSASESHKILATYSGGTADQDYDAVYSFTLNSVTRIARQTVQVRKR